MHKRSTRATATLNAATDLYGAGSTSYHTVAAAWSAVSVS
jgi:zinc metalloprotease ZmpA